MIMLKSNAGEIKSEKEWQREIDMFWDWAEIQTRRNPFIKPANAFERYKKILGLTPVSSYKGVF